MLVSGEIPEVLHDPQRLAALHLSGLLDTPPEQAFDRFTILAQQILNVPVILISLVDKDRQFFKSQVGLPEPWATERQTPLSHSLCQHVVGCQAPLIISDARLNPLVRNNGAVLEAGIVAYAGVPLQTADNHVIGSFCAIDMEPHEWQPREIEVLNALAEMVMREVALREMAQQLQARNEALQKAEEQRNDMVHMVIHDLRTPLSSLLGGLQALDALLETDEMQQKMLDFALRGARSLSEMVNTILDVSRGEEGLLTLERSEISPVSLIATALEQVERLSQQKSLRLSFDVSPDLPVLRADEDKLRRVLVNLLGNAIQHTPASGHIQLSVQMQPDNETFLWCVSDTGSGIAEDQLERIFEKFSQASGQPKTQASSGIGLTFCKMVVEAHGGQIWVNSEVGQGSHFHFTIPPYSSPT